MTGAVDDADARAVARAVISSSLVKAAAHGRDPNWGRIAGAAGNARLGEARRPRGGRPAPRRGRGARSGSPAFVDPGALRIAIAGHLVFDGPPAARLAFDRAAVAGRDGRPRGPRRASTSGSAAGRGEAFGCDLTEQYVIENAEYTT